MALRKVRSTRSTKTTILIVGEGHTEKAFLQHLKELYINREDEINVKIQCGIGGAPCSVVQKAIRLRGSSAYDKCYVLFDADRPLETDYKLSDRMNKRPRIEILKATPCIEGLFLAILKHPGFSQTSASPSNCKREFHDKYIPADKKTDKRSYADKFPPALLDGSRTNISELDAILKAMQVQCYTGQRMPAYIREKALSAINIYLSQKVKAHLKAEIGFLVKAQHNCITVSEKRPLFSDPSQTVAKSLKVSFPVADSVAN